MHTLANANGNHIANPSVVNNTSRTGWEAPKSPVLVVAPNGDEACNTDEDLARIGG